VRTRTRVVLAFCGAVLPGLGGFVVWEEGIPAFQRSQDVPEVSRSEVLSLPEQVYDPPEFVPATDKWGPPGPVSMVFQGRAAGVGFGGEVEGPWYAVSARNGVYSRLAPPDLEHARGRLWLGPQGTQVAWRHPGGIARYDTMTGESQTYPVPGAGDASGPMVWSPDSTRLAFGTDPVQVLDIQSGEVTDLPLRATGSDDMTPAWTADGRWVTLAVDDGIEAVEVESGRQRTLPAPVGGFRGADWNTAGDLAGMHPTQHSNVLRIVRAPDLETDGRSAQVDDEVPEDLVIQGLWGWSDPEQVVLTGLRPETGALEQAVTFSLPDDDVQPFMLLPSKGVNWAGVGTVSLATDLLSEPTRAFEEPQQEWSPTAKLRLCLLLAVFPAVYFLIARRAK
jgi:hypothetical protein